MTVGRAVLLLLGLACLLAAEASQPKTESFAAWLAAQSSAKVQSAYYEEIETTQVCLQELRYQDCRCLHHKTIDGTPYCTREHIEAMVGCCDTGEAEEGYRRSEVKDLWAKPKSFGVCQYIEQYFEDPMAVSGSQVSKIGTFSATCDMGEESDSCGSPLCKGLTLVVDGLILRYSTVAFAGALSDATDDGSCHAFGHPFFDATKNNNGAQLQATQATPSQPDASEASYHAGQGDIYLGTFRVVSRHHQLPHHTGQFQRVVRSGAAGSYRATATPPERSFVAADGAISLDFYSSSSSY